MRSPRIVASVFVALSTVLALACGGTDDAPSHLGSSGKKSPTGTGGFGSSGATADEGASGECAATVAPTEKAKADIVFVIDNSGSMNEEMTQIRQNVNRFADKIGGVGLDYRVLFIVRKIAGASSLSNIGLCVPAPLAGANCADNPPKFFHIDRDVQSSDSLDIILSTYDGSAPLGGNKFDPTGGATTAPWMDKLRFESTKIFVEVTDDESDLSAEEFDRALLAKQPAGMFGTEQHRKYVFHSIISKPAGATVPSTKLCPTAAGTSVQYQKLSQLTGGLMDEVCKTDYSSVLDNIAKGIVDRLACEIGYPNAPGTAPDKVVVRYTPAAGATDDLTQITDASKCSQVSNGWYYDDPTKPSKIILCPSMCGTVNASAAAGAKLEALVGCQAPAPR